MLQIVAFHTPDAAYRREADRLIASATILGLRRQLHVESVTVHGVDDPWRAAVMLKPSLLKAWRRRFQGCDLLMVDADSVLHKDPGDYLAGLNCDLAVHYLRGSELLSGTMYVPASSTRIDAVLDLWASVQDETRFSRRPQTALAWVLGQMGDVVVHRLPPEYCWIFDTSATVYGPRRPVIEHLQASRDFRFPGRRPDRRRARRLAELVMEPTA